MDQREQRDAVQRLHKAFPNFSLSEARGFLERSLWDFSAATALAEREEANRLKEKGNMNFYAGDGQMTLGSRDVDTKEMVNSLFEKARVDQGAEEPERERAFYGEGRRLGHTANPSPAMASTLRPHRESVLEVYQNGFLLENGEFILLESPEGKMGVEEMNKGVVPSFLFKLHPNTDLSVTLQDKSGVPYTPPSHVPFRGEGHRLCGEESTTSAVPAPSLGVKPFAFNENEPSSFILLVSSKGRRQEFKVNPERHTVGDIYGLAKQVEPDLEHFVLVVREIPPRKLDVTKKDETIAAAKLTRAVITIQK